MVKGLQGIERENRSKRAVFSSESVGTLLQEKSPKKQSRERGESEKGKEIV